MYKKTEELIAEARKAAPLYGNDCGALLIKMADRIEQIRAVTFEECAELADRIDSVNGIGDAIRLHGKLK